MRRGSHASSPPVPPGRFPLFARTREVDLDPRVAPEARLRRDRRVAAGVVFVVVAAAEWRRRDAQLAPDVDVARRGDVRGSHASPPPGRFRARTRQVDLDPRVAPEVRLRRDRRVAAGVVVERRRHGAQLAPDEGVARRGDVARLDVPGRRRIAIDARRRRGFVAVFPGVAPLPRESLPYPTRRPRDESAAAADADRSVPTAHRSTPAAHRSAPLRARLGMSVFGTDLVWKARRHGVGQLVGRDVRRTRRGEREREKRESLGEVSFSNVVNIRCNS